MFNLTLIVGGFSWWNLCFIWTKIIWNFNVVQHFNTWTQNQICALQQGKKIISLSWLPIKNQNVQKRCHKKSLISFKCRSLKTKKMIKKSFFCKFNGNQHKKRRKGKILQRISLYNWAWNFFIDIHIYTK